MKNTMKFLQWTAVAVAMTCCLAAKAEDDPNALLKSKGLELDGSTWVLPLEEDLNREMAKLRQLSGEARKAQNETRKFDQMIRKVKGQIGAWKQQHERLVKETRKAMTDNKYNRIVEEINKLEAQINAAEAEGNKRQGELDAELTEALGAYSMEMMNFYDKAEASVKQYAELAKDEEVQAAIKASSEAEGRTITLGPSSNFERQWKTLSRMREELKAGEIPLEKDGNSLWVGVKINGQPIRQMVLDTGCSDISLPFDFARQLGITITPEMPTVQCSLADGSIVECKLVMLETVQIGQFVCKNVEATVMPEHLVAAPPLLGNSYLKNFVMNVDHDKGAMRLTEKATTTKSDYD